MGSQLHEFNVIHFEKRLTALKDSQENINACCKWCLENRQHHKKIVTSWLNVLKRVKVEQRLNLFYLANDVIQYSKRKQYEFVESWGTALQKATTLVRDDKVKDKIIRIFNIWQHRGVYNEEFISDLCGLISVIPTASKNDEPHEFQSSYVINKIKQCSKLENETDLKLKILKEHNPKIQIETESLCMSLKDRAHVDDVEKELETYVKHLEAYINALKAEIKCRITNISVLKQANNHLDKDKRDVKVVANAYKVFGNKVKAFQKKLEEHTATLASPVPSPDINAPSPSPDCDIELPDDNENSPNNQAADYNLTSSFTAGYYNPVPPPTTEAENFVSNGYTSFIGSSFNVHYQDGSHLPLLPPPMPPFSAKSNYENSYNPHVTTEKTNYVSSYTTSNTNFNPSVYDTTSMRSSFTNSNVAEYTAGGFEPPDGSNPYPPNSEEYNPEQEPETWEPDVNWTQPHLDPDTPESPPIFEKEGYIEGVEYHDNVVTRGAADVDHRILHPLSDAIETVRGRGKDVDHRNLISLTGSPADSNSNISSQPGLWNASDLDKDYRTNVPSPNTDQDYRLPPFNIEQLKLPPPPPPPPKPFVSPNQFFKKEIHSKKLIDNVESIDMELSEEETEENQEDRENFKVVDNDIVGNSSSLRPPPPFPDLPDDADANTFLDDLDNELNSNEFTANLQDPDNRVNIGQPPPTMNIPSHMVNVPPQNLLSTNGWMLKQQNNNLNLSFRRGNRGSIHNNVHRTIHRGRGRGTFSFRGANHFRGRGFNKGIPNKLYKSRGNIRGNYQGGF